MRLQYGMKSCRFENANLLLIFRPVGCPTSFLQLRIQLKIPSSCIFKSSDIGRGMFFLMESRRFLNSLNFLKIPNLLVDCSNRFFSLGSEMALT